jgi:hypothetical protein
MSGLSHSYLRAMLFNSDGHVPPADASVRATRRQMKFHSAFERCVARVIYKQDWATSRPAIMRWNEWPRCSSEVLIR